MRVLIVGCGYVGLPLGKVLASDGDEVYGLRRTHAADEELKLNGITPIYADIAKPSTLTELRPDYDWVVNCVSSAGGSADEYRLVYLEGTRNVIKWLAASSPRKYVYTSSTSVYGQTDSSVVDEASPVQPEAETAKILVQTEQLLLGPQEKLRLNALILRIAGIYGPDRGYWLRQYLNGQARIEGNGQRWLNMVHRDDVVGAIAAALQRGTSGEIYNVIDDQPVTQLALYQWLSTKTGRALPPTIQEQVGNDRKRGVTNRRISNRKLKQNLGYKFKYPTFKEGFAQELENRH
jgi:nucleoside-diphosphate-sugar epimerase